MDIGFSKKALKFENEVKCNVVLSCLLWLLMTFYSFPCLVTCTQVITQFAAYVGSDSFNLFVHERCYK